MAEKSFLSNHPINTTLNNLLRLFEDAEYADAVNALESDLRVVANAIELYTRQTAERVSKSSDREVSQNGLRQVASNLQNVWNELNAFRSNKSSGHITNAANNFDGALSASSWTFFSRPAKGSRAYGESVRAVQNAADAALDKLRNRASGVASRFTEFENKLGGLESLIKGSEDKLGQISSAADAQISEIKAEFASIKTDIEQERQSDRETRAEEFESFFADQKKIAEDLTTKIEEYENKAKRILQIVGNIGLTGNFKKRSIDENVAANFWRWATIILFGLGIGLITVSLLNNIFANSTLELLFIRLAIGIAITLPAFYTAKESARHRTNSDQAKQTELELASLTPFIEGMPEEDRWKIVASLTPRYFGSSRVQAHDPEISLPTDKLISSVEKLIEKIPKA